MSNVWAAPNGGTPHRPPNAPVPQQPQFQQSAQDPQPAPPGQPAVTRWAVATLVLGLLALVPLAIPAAVVASVRIRRHGRRGLGLVIGGVVACGLWLMLAAVVGIVALLVERADGPGSAFPEPTAQAPAPVPQDAVDGAGWIGDLAASVGSCVNPPAAGGAWEQVLCTEPHFGEVVWSGEGVGAARWRVNDYPGEQVLLDGAAQQCSALYEQYYADFVTVEVESVYFIASKEDWRLSTDNSACVVYRSDGEPLTAPLREGGS